MFDYDDMMMGPSQPRKKKKQRYQEQRPLFGDMGASQYDGFDDYQPRQSYYKPRKSMRTVYRKKQKPVDYSKQFLKGAKATYKGTKKGIAFGKKVGQRITDKRLTGLRQKLKGSIYGKK